MTKEDEDRNRVAAYHISRGLHPLMLMDFQAWLAEDPDRVGRASRLLTILHRDREHKLKVRTTDLFRNDHLASTEITVAAEERADDHEVERPHVKACTVCNAFIEVEAARIVFERGMESSDLTGVEARTRRHLTDNDKGFGRAPTPRE